jgi:hypothetical protein
MFFAAIDLARNRSSQLKEVGQFGATSPAPGSLGWWIEIRGEPVFGCFILFGASSIAQGIMAGENGFTGQQVTITGTQPFAYAPRPTSYPQRPAQPFDPYAGAAIPTQR